MPLSPIKLTAGAGAAATSMYFGSLFGDSGTLIGAALGSVTYGVAAEGYEFAVNHTHQAARKKLHREQAGVRRIEETKPKIKWTSKKIWVPATVLAGTSCVAALGILAVTEAASGQTFHGLTTGQSDYGTSFTHTAASPTPSVTPSPSILPSSPSISPSPSPTETLVPTVVPTITVSPSITSVPVTPSTQPSATISP